MERSSGLPSALGLRVAEHVYGDSLADVQAGADPVDRLLHLAMSPVGAFYSVGCGGEKFFIEEREGFVQRGGKQLLEGLAHRFETPDAETQSREFLECGIGSTTAVKKAVDFVHDLAEGG